MSKLICGIDEAGRGPLAGPVVAAAVVWPLGASELPGVDDSKKLSARKRELLFPKIMDGALAVGVGIIDEGRIDEINILQATFEAMRQAVAGLGVRPDRLLVDGNREIPGIDIDQVAIVHGDATEYSIAAASIIAKVTRDRIMIEYDKLYPEYGFARHKGYGTQAHMDAISTYGPCPIHRKTFLK